MHERTQLETARERQGFTIMEMIVSVVVISILISLLVLGVQATKRTAGSVLDVSSVNQVFAGVTQFKQEIGFLPPVVKEFSPGNALSLENAIVRDPGNSILWANLIVAEPPVGSEPPRNRIAVYTRGSNADFFRGVGADYRGPTATNYLQDNRFSQLTLGYYIAGQLEFAFDAALTDVPIDGVTGAGMYKPEKGGMFDVPGSMRRPTDRKRQGKTFGPYVDASSKAMRVETDAVVDPQGRDVTVRDRNGVPIRYYYWLQKPSQPNQDPDVTMEIPRIIGRVPDVTNDPNVPEQMNPKINTAIRGATWAIVAAGPDKVFGDESITYITQTLGKSATSAAEVKKLRLQAASDNIIKLGTED